MDALINWLLAFAFVLVFLVAIYFVVKLAVRSAMKEIFRAFGEELAQNLWEEEMKGRKQ